ncbi:MAG: hypothetical protein EOP51_05930 [Sphingobacteriales bacterium]|nr:MAG: hypothetical protein EOP51_05930 [Sphingobacteriales bacterium]
MQKLKVKIVFLFLFSFLAPATQAQQADTSVFKFPIQMDAVVIKAARGGWNVNAFIRRVKTDTTFYKAFRTMRLVSYTATNDIRVYDKKGKVSASLYSRTKQHAAGGCRTTQTLEEKTTGDFYKRNKEYRYYTAELYAYLFFTKGKICGENDKVAGALNERGKGQIEKSKYQLKQLIFNPGSRIAGVPLMGDKAAIFEPQVAKLYDFKLLSEEYSGVECYVFKAIPKPGKEDDVVYDELTTWFRKSDYAIIARDYSLSYKTMVYDFNVRMKVRTTEVGGKLLPSTIDYDGNWHVFSQDRERVKFHTVLSY